jgi:Periplasmic component of the Tol biopolymer transport system
MHEATRRKLSQTARTARIVGLTLIVVPVALGTGFLHRASTRATWPTAIPASNPALQVETLRPLTATEACQDAFLAHPLTHVTRAKGEVVTYYDSNGSGIAADDLDGDGDLDLVLANLNGPNVVAWNEGDFTFREQPLTFGGSRAVAIVDLDGDGGRDLTFTQGFGAILAYRDDGSSGSDVSRYQRINLRGVDQPAYAMDWMDVDLDGNLDLLTASYDTMLAKDRRDGFLFGRQGGVTLYLADGDAYQPVRLSNRAQALAVALHDVTGDGWPDVIVGNDFEVPDDVFVNPGASGGDWSRGSPFPLTTRNTMVST